MVIVYFLRELRTEIAHLIRLILTGLSSDRRLISKQETSSFLFSLHVFYIINLFEAPQYYLIENLDEFD